MKAEESINPHLSDQEPSRGPPFRSTARTIRSLFDAELRERIAGDQSLLDNYCKRIFGHKSVAEATGDCVFRFLDKNDRGETLGFRNAQEVIRLFDIESLHKLRTKLKNRPFRDALVDFVVALHGMWIFVWDDSASAFRFMPAEKQLGRLDPTDGRISFGGDLRYKSDQDFQNAFLKRLLNTYELRPGQGSVGLSLRLGCAVCLRDTVADLRGSVPFEDYVLGNLSYCGVPIFHVGSNVGRKKTKTEYPIAHLGVFFPAREAWHDHKCCYSVATKEKCFTRFLSWFAESHAQAFVHNAHDHLASDAFRKRAL